MNVKFHENCEDTNRKLINYSCCCHPTRTPHSGQMNEIRNSMKNELKTRRVWKRFQTRCKTLLNLHT